MHRPRVLRSGSFYLLYLMMALVTASGLMLSAQLKPIAVSYGYDKMAFVQRLHGIDADAVAESGVEWIGAAILWLGIGSHRTLRHDGNSLRV
jgi:hypothetical protein